MKKKTKNKKDSLNKLTLNVPFILTNDCGIPLGGKIEVIFGVEAELTFKLIKNYYKRISLQ
jgi:hypothetical protein